MRVYTGRKVMCATVSCLALCTTPSVAQTIPTAVDEIGPSDIVVTANKREERIQDVALSITAVSGDELNNRRLIDIQDLASRVPGFSFSRGGSAAGGQGPGQRVVIRGLNTGGVSGTVASVLDDVPLTASATSSASGEFAADFDPYDLQRIEVLKGPQGTLYGASSLGGLVKYVTNAPSPAGVTAGFDVGVSNIRHGDTGAFAKGFINLPINENAAIRASGHYEYTPGWIRNDLSNNPATNYVRRYGGRVALLLNATENFTIRAQAVIQQRNSGGYDNVEVQGFLDPDNAYDLLKGYNKDTFVDERNRAKSQIYSLNLDYDLGGITLQSITSYGKLVTQYRYDNPFYVPLSGAFFGRPDTTLTSENLNSVKKLNQEFRIASDGAAAAANAGLEWQIGAFFTRERTESTSDFLTRDIFTGETVITPASQAATPPGTPQVFLGQINTRYKEYAAYADFTYYFSPSFDIEAGGRVFHNRQSFTQTTGGALYFPAEFQTFGPFRSSETRATFAVAPRFHLNRDLIVYARVASGYRPGGPNLAVPPAGPAPDTPGEPPTSFGADTTVNYEIGIKGDVWNNRLFFDIAAFYIDWSDIQVSTAYRRGFTGYTINLNAGKAVSKGIEWNLNVRPIRGLNIGWLGTYNKATLSDEIPEIAGTSGSQLPFVPKWATTVTADFEFPVSDGVSASFGGAYAYTGGRRTGYLVDPDRTYQPMPSFGTISAQAGIRFGDYQVQVYGKNLTDKRGITSYERGSVLLGVPLLGQIGLIRPREIGVRLTGSF